LGVRVGPTPQAWEGEDSSASTTLTRLPAGLRPRVATLSRIAGEGKLRIT
jgi:hypothetical protein